jgi:hypothetical protein
MKYKIFLALLVFGCITGLAIAATETAKPGVQLAANTTKPDDKKADQPETYDINYVYDPAGRRDPFVNLLTGVKVKGPKVPPGALTVGDAKIVGITRNQNSFVAIIVGADNKARFMKVGDKLYDGAIIGIEADKVIFRQDFTEDNPAAPGLRSKEVVKRLNPVQEGTQ